MGGEFGILRQILAAKALGGEEDLYAVVAAAAQGTFVEEPGGVVVSGTVVTLRPLGIEFPGFLGEGRETAEQEKEEK